MLVGIVITFIGSILHHLRPHRIAGLHDMIFGRVNVRIVRPVMRAVKSSPMSGVLIGDALLSG